MHHTHISDYLNFETTCTHVHTHIHKLTRIKVWASTSLQTPCLSMIFTCKVKSLVILHRSQRPYNITCSKHTTFYKNFTAVLLKVNKKCISNTNNLTLLNYHKGTDKITYINTSSDFQFKQHKCIYATSMKYDIASLHCITTNMKNKTVVPLLM